MRRELHLAQTGLILIALAVGLIGGTSLVTSHLGDRFKRQHADLAREHDRLTKQITLWEENVRAAQDLRGQLSKVEIDGLLAPMPAARLMPTIEAMAALSHLTHLKLSVSDGKPWDGGTTLTGIEGVNRYSVSLDAQAPLDSNIYRFLGSLPNLGGHLELNEIAVTRLTQEKPTALNVSLKLRGFWYGNGDSEGRQ